MSLKPTPSSTPGRTGSPALSLNHTLSATEQGYNSSQFAGKQSQKEQVSAAFDPR